MTRKQFEAWLYSNCVLLPGNTFEWAKALIERGMEAEEELAGIKLKQLANERKSMEKGQTVYGYYDGKEYTVVKVKPYTADCAGGMGYSSGATVTVSYKLKNGKTKQKQIDALLLSQTKPSK